MFQTFKVNYCRDWQWFRHHDTIYKDSSIAVKSPFGQEKLLSRENYKEV